MVGAILVGVLVGALGFVPYYVAFKLIRRSKKPGGAGQAVTLIGFFLISTAILAIGIAVCALNFHDVLLPFSLAAVGTLIVVTAAFGLRHMLPR